MLTVEAEFDIVWSVRVSVCMFGEGGSKSGLRKQEGGSRLPSLLLLALHSSLLKAPQLNVLANCLKLTLN